MWGQVRYGAQPDNMVHRRTQETENKFHTYLVPNMQNDSNDLVSVSVWGRMGPICIWGAQKHIPYVYGVQRAPYVYGVSHMYMGSICVWGFTYIPYVLKILNSRSWYKFPRKWPVLCLCLVSIQEKIQPPTCSLCILLTKGTAAPLIEV